MKGTGKEPGCSSRYEASQRRIVRAQSEQDRIIPRPVSNHSSQPPHTNESYRVCRRFRVLSAVNGGTVMGDDRTLSGGPRRARIQFTLPVWRLCAQKNSSRASAECVVRQNKSFFTNLSGWVYTQDVAVRFKCKIHGVPLVCFCPACHGGIRTARKARASKRNGKLGGRPKVKR